MMRVRIENKLLSAEYEAKLLAQRDALVKAIDRMRVSGGKVEFHHAYELALDVLAQVKDVRGDIDAVPGTESHEHKTLCNEVERLSSVAAYETDVAETYKAEADRLREENESLRMEVERFRQCLQKANAQAEHFEREWYLRGDEIERLQSENAVQKKAYGSLKTYTENVAGVSPFWDEQTSWDVGK